MFWVLRNQMLQSCLNNYLEINLLLTTVFWIYKAEHFLGLKRGVIGKYTCWGLSGGSGRWLEGEQRGYSVTS